MLLYHGTSEKHLANIIMQGLRPRRATKKDNWEHTVPSNGNCVYLTNAYPLYFANAVQEWDDESRLVVLEVDERKLDMELFCADEDFLAQANANPKMKHLDVNAKNEYYKRVMYRYSHLPSLQHMGTCAYRGPINVHAITRVAFITHEASSAMFMRGYDPTITIMNFKFQGEQYMKSTKWLFDPDQIQQEYLTFHVNGEEQKISQIPMLEDRSGIEVAHFAQLVNNAICC